MKTRINSINYTTISFLAVALLAVSGDITMTWTSPMLPKLYSNDSTINPLSQPITKDEDAWIASLIGIGAMIGGFPFSYMSEHFGRKIALLTIGVFHITAFLAMAFAEHVELFYFGRVFGGLAVGGGYTLLPMYVAEIVEESKRGAYLVTLAIFWAFGDFFSLLIGPFFSSNIFNLINVCFPVTFFIIFSLLGTETPFYLVGANQIDKAEEVLMLLRSKNSKEVQDELQHIKDGLDNEEKFSSYKIIFTNRGIRKAFIISISLIIFEIFSGWIVISFYLQPIFEASGTDLSPEISSLIVGAALFGFSIPAPYFASNFGRKTLIMFGSATAGLSLAVLGVFFFMQARTDISSMPISWIPLASLVIVAFSFETGLAGIPWTVSAEVFPKNVKELGAATTCTTCWIALFLITQFFNDLTEALGRDGTIFMFAGCCFANFMFTFFYVPETKGMTFIQIQEMLQK